MLKPIRYFVRDNGPEYTDRWGFFLVDSVGDFTGDGWNLSDNADQADGCCTFIGWPGEPTGYPWRGPKDCRELPKGTRRQMAALLRQARKERAELYGLPC